MDSITVTVTVNEGFDRLERRLLDMQVGDRLRPADAAKETGLAPELCLAVLAGLEKAGLMQRRDEDCFVRRRLDLSAATGN
jgi:hypothetical protein